MLLRVNFVIGIEIAGDLELYALLLNDSKSEAFIN